MIHFPKLFFSSFISATKFGALASTLTLAAGLSAQAATVSFSDSFSPGPSSQWNNYAGNWTASNGQYYAQKPNNNPFTITALPYDLSNYSLTVTVNALSDAGIVLRSDGTNDGIGVVQLILGGDGYGQGTRGGNAGSALYFCTTALGCNVGEVDGVFTPGNTYTISVTATGNTYSVYLNGSSTATDTFVDSSDPITGQVGLYDDQPNVTTGSGFGTPNTFSNFSLNGTLVGSAATAPEPASLGLLGCGLVAVATTFYRRNR